MRARRHNYAGTWKWEKDDLVSHILHQPHPVEFDNLPSRAKLLRSSFEKLHGIHCRQHGMPGYIQHEIVAHGFTNEEKLHGRTG